MCLYVPKQAIHSIRYNRVEDQYLERLSNEEYSEEADKRETKEQMSGCSLHFICEWVEIEGVSYCYNQQNQY